MYPIHHQYYEKYWERDMYVSMQETDVLYYATEKKSSNWLSDM